MSQTQYMDALAKANQTRFKRAAIKAMLRKGEITFLDALRQPSCATATLYSMLTAQWRWGDRRTIVFFGELADRWNTPISYVRRVGELTDREVAVICRALGEEA